MKNKEKKENEVKEVTENNVKEEKKVVVNPRARLQYALASKEALQASRTVKNTAKFSNDNVPLRAYEVSKGIIEELKLTKENAFDTMKAYFARKPLDVQGKDIKKAQRFLASLCCKASGQARSTSTFQQDITELSKVQNREYIKVAFPAFDDNVLDIIFKATYTPSRTK